MCQIRERKHNELVQQSRWRGSHDGDKTDHRDNDECEDDNVTTNVNEDRLQSVGDEQMLPYHHQDLTSNPPFTFGHQSCLPPPPHLMPQNSMKDIYPSQAMQQAIANHSNVQDYVGYHQHQVATGGGQQAVIPYNLQHGHSANWGGEPFLGELL